MQIHQYMVTDSATENRPPASFVGKGEKVR